MTSRLTLNAWVFIFLTAFTIIVASVFHTPLLVYTAVFLVSANLVLFAWSFHAVRGLKVKRHPPSFGVAGQQMEVGLELTNERTTARYGTLGFDLHEQLTPGREYSPVAFLVAPAGQPVRSSYTITPPRRGVFRIGPLYLWGGDPFGFYKNWRKLDLFNTVLVLPRALDFKMTQPPSISALSRDEMGSIPVGGQSNEFLGVRDYVQGEQIKHIHWRTSARLGKLISRQYEMNVAASVSVLMLVDDNMRAGSGADTPLEYAITMAASLGSATSSSRFQFNLLTMGARAIPLTLHSDGSVEQLGSFTRGDGFNLDFLSRELWGAESRERKRRSPAAGEMPYDSMSGSGKRFYQEMAIRLARLGEYGPIDWELANRLIVHYLPQGSSLIILTCDPSVEAWERLGLMALRYRSITVVNFDKASFERGRSGWVEKRDEEGEKRNSYRPGFQVYQVHYKDDLSRALSDVFGKSMSATRSRAGAVASSSKMLSEDAIVVGSDAAARIGVEEGQA